MLIKALVNLFNHVIGMLWHLNPCKASTKENAMGAAVGDCLLDRGWTLNCGGHYVSQCLGPN